MNPSKSVLIRVLKFLLFATAFTPLIVTWSTIFPYIFGKVVFFRSIIELALILFLVYLIYGLRKSLGLTKSQILKLFKNPLFIFTILFILSLVISTIFAVNPYRAFWGTIDRGEGLFGMLHYFAFLILALLIFEKKDWLNFFKIYLVVGLILIFYAFLQYFKVYNFPFALKFENLRPGSFIGNPSFLAVHLIFLMMFAVAVFFKSIYRRPTSLLRTSDVLKLNFWRYFSLLIIFLAVLTIFLTGTRGAILGLGAGVFVLLLYFSIYGHRKSLGLVMSQKLAAGLLILILIFSGIFWFTRGNVFWQKIPGLGRLTKTAVLDINDPSTQYRLITWRLSWNAFKEKPLFGWGPDNYLVAYEKYYEPDYALYGETWLDRAHNKIFDVLVMQGIFGFLTYLGIFIAAFYLLFRKYNIGTSDVPNIDNNLRTSDVQRLDYSRPIIAALLIAYFVQNLVLFDQLNSDMAFFVLLGFLISRTLIYADNKSVSISQNPYQSVFIKLLSTVIVIVAVGFLGYSVYAFNYAPFVQAKAFQKSPSFGDVNFMEKKLKEAMYPYNFAQYNIRSLGVDAFYLDPFFYNPNFMGNPGYRVIADLLIEGMDEMARREPFDIRVMIREVEMLNGVTRAYPFKDENEAVPLFKKAEALMRESLKRAPNRQEVYYHLAFNLAGQKRYEESIEAARYAVSLNPKVTRARYHLFLMLALAGRNEEALKELAIFEEMSPNYEGLMGGDINTVMLFYYNLGRADKVTELLIKSLDGRMLRHRFGRQYYERALGYFAGKEDAEHFLLLANFLAGFDDLKEDMEILMDLVKNGHWDIIHNL